jgi:hypothetical protein
MDTTQQASEIGDIANGYNWTGHEWASIPNAGESGGPTPWYRKPWAFAMYGVLGAVTVLVVVGAIAGEAPENSAAAEDAVSIEQPAAVDQQAQPAAEEPVAAEPSDASDVEAAAPVTEHDSLTYQSAVSGAQGDVLDLRGDLADLERDLSSGSLGWAAWNFAEIAFNVGQLQAVDAPPSIGTEWAALMAELLAADEQLSAGFEADSMSQMQSGVASMKQTLDQMEVVLGSW